MTFREGDRFTVRNATLGGRGLIEGSATVVVVYQIDEDTSGAWTLVRFDDEPEALYRRYLLAADRVHVETRERRDELRLPETTFRPKGGAR